MKKSKTLMDAIIGVMGCALVIDFTLSPTIIDMFWQIKIGTIERKIGKIQKHHNPLRVTMIQAKRCCKTTY
jgi:hypothetical protein